MVFRLAVPLTLMCCLAAPLAAQEAARAASGTTGSLASEREFIPILERAVSAAAASEEEKALAAQLSACLRPLFPDSPEHADITFGIEIGADGRPGTPYLLEPSADEASLAHLRQLFRAETAVHDCAPLNLSEKTEAPVLLRLAATSEALTPLATESVSTAFAEEVEANLGLSAADRREIQVRLRLAGQDPGGADGVFGPRTRGAIAAWQEYEEYPVTGFVTQPQLDMLEILTLEDYTAYQSQRARRTQTSRARYYTGRDGCLRYSNGVIVAGRSLPCDLRRLAQNF